MKHEVCMRHSAAVQPSQRLLRCKAQICRPFARIYSPISHSRQTNTNNEPPAPVQSPSPPFSFSLHLVGAGRAEKICLESFSSVVFIHLPVQGIWLMSLSGECSKSSLLSSQSLTAVVKVWSSSSMRRTRPKEPSRSFQPVSSQSFPPQPSPPARVPGRKKETEGTTSGETTTENDAQVSISISFRSDFATVLRAPCHVYHGEVLNDMRCSRSMRRLRVVSPFDFSVWCGRRRRPGPLGFHISIPHRFPRAFQSSLSRIRFHRMTIAQRTTLSNQLRLCRIPKHSRCRRRLQRHVRS
jgi:hypothetical protein